jgi:hypothetical protein
MATTISKVKNDSANPVAYVGKGGAAAPTGWSAYAFPPSSESGFGWTVETHQYAQALLTKAGEFYIWDDGNYNIMYQPVGKPAAVLVHVNWKIPIAIAVQVDGNGNPSARQL